MEAWHEKLFETWMRDPLPNCNAISMQQLKEADKLLWRKLSEKTRGNIAQQATGAKPVQLQLITLTVDPEVHFLLLPTSRPQTRPGPYDKDPKPGKGDKKGKGKGKEQPFQLPDGCHQKTEQGRANQFAIRITEGFASSLLMENVVSEVSMFVGNVSNHSPIPSVAGLHETHRLGFLQLVRKRNASM